jgi:RND superfamily putative drug exporter
VSTALVHAEAGLVARTYARVVVAGRLVILLGWLVVVAVAVHLPTSNPGADADLEGFVPSDSAAVSTETDSLRAFGFPLTSRTVLVQRKAGGLSPYDQTEAVLRAIALTQGSYRDADLIEGALPVTNTLELFPSSSERGTTVLTYLFIRPGRSFATQTEAAREFATEHLAEPEDAFVGVTGSIPARSEQVRILRDWLPLLEGATLAVVVGIVALKFRSVVAPLVALLTSGLSFFVAVRLAEFTGSLVGVSLPRELHPLILALVLGVATDYSIFFLNEMRRRLAAGADRLVAARASAALTGPIVAVAGLAVAAGTGVLVVAESAFFSAFGPAMALAVSVAVLVSLTLVPALLATFGRLLFWPAGMRGSPESRLARFGVRQMVRTPIALVVVAACVLGLGALATSTRDIRLGVSFLPSLPERAEARQAATAAAAGFAPGILAPTVLLLQGEGATEDRPALSRLGRAVARERGVAGVLGPGDLVPALERRALVAPASDASRFLVILEDEPLGADAIATLERLSRRLPGLLATAGLPDAEFGFAGDTALAGELVMATRQDLGRIAVAVLLTNLVLLVFFLRALLAPLLLLASSVLALLAALGATVQVFQGFLGHSGITFYVPFASAVLLLSLGSDYNIFGVGYVWARTARLPVRDAIVEVFPGTSSAITAAGVTLAASFGMLALVPLRPFQEFALVMTVGILLDALVVRSLLVPALLALLGRWSLWPRRPPPAKNTWSRELGRLS